MASSFISKDKKNGFWIHDSLFQVFCNLLAKNIKNSRPSAWLDELATHLIDNGSGLYSGFMHLDFEDILNTKLKIDIFIKYVDQLIDMISEKGPLISVDELNSLIINSDLQADWVTPLATSKLIGVGETLKRLLRDEIDSVVDDPFFQNH